MPAPDFAWLDLPATLQIIDALGADKIRFVGGAVRDSLLDLPVQDIDIATPLHPAEVMVLAQNAGLKVVPTGIDHGTVTVVAQHRPFEVTTLRRDVSTDGRRATVAFTDDWQEDAARRDFTINALYMNSDRQIFDYFGGRDDLAARHVRFIGDAQARIGEDALRILRFFRFSARFAVLPLDAHGLQACVILARNMMSLSRERIRDEMLKLLGAQNPLPVLELMLQHRLFEIFLPEVTSLAALKALLHLEQRYHLPDPLRRFAALLPAKADSVSDIAARFKTSRQVRGRLVDAAAHLSIVDAAAMRAAIYRYGNIGAVDKLLLGSDPATDIAALLDLGQHWRAPQLPFSGKHLIAAGISAGPAVSQALQALEADWIARDFPLDQPSLDALFKAAAARWQSHL